MCIPKVKFMISKKTVVNVVEGKKIKLDKVIYNS